MGRGREIIGLAAAVGGMEATGWLSALASGTDFRTYFESLRKPPGTARPAVFGPAWRSLYLLMGVAAWLMWREALRVPYLAGVGFPSCLNAGVGWLQRGPAVGV